MIDALLAVACMALGALAAGRPLASRPTLRGTDRPLRRPRRPA
jgi:hypothetical protein